MAVHVLSRRSVAPYVFLAPAIVFGFVFFAMPLGVSLYLSLSAWNSLSPPRWVGLLNYEFLLTRDPLFLQSLLNTLALAAGTLVIGLPLALLIAYAFTRSRFRTLWRSIYWLPMVTNVVAIGTIWAFVLDDTYGLANRLLGLVGFAGPGWLTDPSIAMISVILIFVWAHIGQNMLLFSAGLDGIDGSCEEAARIDGANAWQVFTRVTLPLLKPTILFVAVTNLISGMSYFALMLVLTEGGPANSTNVAGLYIYQMAFTDLRLGRASAAAYILLLLILLITLAQVKIMRRGGVDAY